uniref:Smoothelin, like n=1 Tax=Poecilia reticulata TaxID=8081 RepID=A0A3P9NVJ0_POERE
CLQGPVSSVSDGETVCSALTRYENTLQDAIREIHAEVNNFKLDIERRCDETANLSGPLGQAVLQLQQENRQLRIQLEALTRQVELLNGLTCDLSSTRANLTSSPTSSSSPPAGSRGSSMMMSPGTSSSPSITRFSSRATFAVSSKTNVSTAKLDSLHFSCVEHSVLVQGKVSPPVDGPLEHAAPVTLRMPHLPITATTKTAEIKASTNSPSSPVGSMSFPSSEASPSVSRPQPAESSALQPAPIAKTWTPTPVRTLGSPHHQDKTNSAPSKSVTYSGLQHNDSQVGERRRELVRSQTLPRSIGAQARRSIFERLDSEVSHSRPKPAGLKRSQSFGVSTASSIKQILLEWCRSKTIGYQNIDIQNFSSSWSDGMAFCALVHSFFPTEFDYNALSPVNRKHNFELAFGTAETKAGCDRLIEVEDMMIMGRKPDPMCVFTYVQSLYNHLRKFE